MSGIYLVVWDEKSRDQTELLKPTRGGWPHLTLVYSGKHVSPVQLTAVAKEAMDQWVLQPVTLTKAYVNSFEDRPGHTRHDVLLAVSKDDEQAVEASRTTLLRERFPEHDKFFMRDPHVTNGIFETVEEAVARAEYLNTTLLPYQVVITGVTID